MTSQSGSVRDDIVAASAFLSPCISKVAPHDLTSMDGQRALCQALRVALVSYPALSTGAREMVRAALTGERVWCVWDVNETFEPDARLADPLSNLRILASIETISPAGHPLVSPELFDALVGEYVCEE